MAVAGRNGTLFLSLFDHYFTVYTVITSLINIPENSNLIFSNSYLLKLMFTNFWPEGLKHSGRRANLVGIMFVFYLQLPHM